MLRDRGSGPTVIVSPLLALMRNQLEMTDRLGLVAHTVNSTNRDEWDGIFDRIHADELDLLLISPERLNNPTFLEDVRSRLFSDIGLLVIDEVHCISDWGHDFRPDYRRLEDIAGDLPSGTPVLGTTATANDRVVEDVREQLGRTWTCTGGPWSGSRCRSRCSTSPTRPSGWPGSPATSPNCPVRASSIASPSAMPKRWASG
jgi:ATP-dependent DNA helicase RecQ